MQWFYDLKTVHKMNLLVAVMAAGMVIIGFIGDYFNSEAANSLKVIYDHNLKPMKSINQFRIHLNANKANILALILENDINQQEYIQDIRLRAKQAVQDLNDFKKDMQELNDQKALNLVNNIEQNLKSYKQIRDEAIKLAVAGQDQRAFQTFAKTDPIFKDMVKDLNEAATNITDRAEKRYQTSEANEKLATQIIIGVSLVVLAFCIWLGQLTSTKIKTILDKLSDKMNAVAKGDLTVEKLGRIEKSDLGDLCIVFDTMLSNLYDLVKEVNTSVQDITAATEEMTAAIDQTAQGSQNVSTSVNQLAAGTNQAASNISQLSESTNHVATNISQLSEGSQQVATSITQLATGIQQISRSIENGANNISDINKAIQNVSGEAKLVAKLGNDTETNANQGAEHVKKAVDKIHSIKQVADDISVNISELGQLSSQIEEIVDLIKSIAGQTNLLALNAAIEAARAGEHGKGFAVVADEVKKLAGQSANATEKITAMIKEIQNKTSVAVLTVDKATHEVEEGVLVINDAGKALDNIISQAKAANDKIQGITKDIDDVAKGSDDLVSMIQDISSVTEETSASTEEIASITEQTAASAQEIANLTEQAATNAGEVSCTIQQSSANTEEISSIIEEQTASLEEINASSQSLAKIAENLHNQISIFKI